jgi:hypothetical protein
VKEKYRVGKSAFHRLQKMLADLQGVYLGRQMAREGP